MADTPGKRDRSPNFPCISLRAAADRLAALDKYFGRHPAPLTKIGLAWGLKENSDQALQFLSAMRYYGLVDYQGDPPTRQAVITEPGRTYLRAQQETVRHQIMCQAALRPRMIRKLWETWGPDRPPDPVCTDALIIHNGFSDRGAQIFLKIYDDTIAFAELARSDKIDLDENGDDANNDHELPTLVLPDPPLRGSDRLMDGERELTTGLLSKDSSFRLIVSGPVGVKEIERLIRKLELDKEILADEERPLEEAGNE